MAMVMVFHARRPAAAEAAGTGRQQLPNAQPGRACRRPANATGAARACGRPANVTGVARSRRLDLAHRPDARASTRAMCSISGPEKRSLGMDRDLCQGLPNPTAPVACQAWIIQPIHTGLLCLVGVVGAWWWWGVVCRVVGVVVGCWVLVFFLWWRELLN
jgi:hypothetical protein